MPNVGDNKLIRNRQDFIMGNTSFSPANVRPSILESWHRSQKAGVNFEMSILPSPDYENAKNIYRKDWHYRKDATRNYLNRFFSYTDSMGAVILFLDLNLLAVSYQGNKSLIAKLREKNIGLGANFQEIFVGTNAAALALAKEAEEYVRGAEHYIEALLGYATIATPFYRENNILKGVIMMIIPEKLFHPAQVGLLSNFSDLLSSTLVTNELILTNNFIHLYLAQNDRGLIYVDQRGVILKVNQYLIDAGFYQSTTSLNRLEDYFPELQITLNCLKNGNSIEGMEVNFKRKAHNSPSFFMDCQPVSNIGMIISLQEKKKVHKTVVRVANYTAHYSIDDLIGNHPLFLAAKNIIPIAAASPSNVLITGESGTGKELFAQAIHNASSRAKAPFISINCSAIPRELIGSELFGYVEGAFTGARKTGAVGKIELADQGTLFLDEIGDMPIDMQSVLLRVLEERMITRIGGYQQIPVDVKIIAATNKNLLESIDKHDFRLDLYYRLNVINLEIPSLRYRPDDIKILTTYFIAYFNQLLNKNITGIAPDALELLSIYKWPGNVRELRNVIERCINNTNHTITRQDLPAEILAYRTTATDDIPYGTANNVSIIEEFKNLENKKILDLMLKFNGNKTKVANELGITRATLYRKLQTINNHK